MGLKPSVQDSESPGHEIQDSESPGHEIQDPRVRDQEQEPGSESPGPGARDQVWTRTCTTPGHGPTMHHTLGTPLPSPGVSMAHGQLVGGSEMCRGAQYEGLI